MVYTITVHMQAKPDDVEKLKYVFLKATVLALADALT